MRMNAQTAILEERLRYLRELDERRAAILDSISQQGKLDAALKQAIDAADTKTRLEDLYLPYRPKRRTKAQIAREASINLASASNQEAHYMSCSHQIPISVCLQR
jgi:uncharacterized protein